MQHGSLADRETTMARSVVHQTGDIMVRTTFSLTDRWVWAAELAIWCDWKFLKFPWAQRFKFQLNLICGSEVTVTVFPLAHTHTHRNIQNSIFFWNRDIRNIKITLIFFFLWNAVYSLPYSGKEIKSDKIKSTTKQKNWIISKWKLIF